MRTWRAAGRMPDLPTTAQDHRSTIRRKLMVRTSLVAALTAVALSAGTATAQDTIKIGLILPMTGQQASTGKQINAAVRLYLQQNGTTVAGRKIEVILKDDAAVADNTKRI